MTRQLAAAEFAGAVGVWGTVLALGVHAWHEGGPRAVGLMGLSRALASGLGSPILGGLADRASRRSILLGANVGRTAIVIALTGLLASGAGLPPVFILMAALGLLDPLYESVSGALLAESVTDAGGLASANARMSVAGNGGFLIGSAAAGVVVAAASTSVALGLLAGCFALSLVPLGSISGAGSLAPQRPSTPVGSMGAVRDLVGSGGLREAAGFLGVLSTTDGAIDVLAVCAALGYLGAGDAGAGLLQAMIGVGTIAGSMVFVPSRRAHRLRTGVVAGSAVLAGSLLTVGSAGGMAATTVILGVGGLGYAMAEVGSLTLVQRRAAADRRVRVLGVVVSMKAVAYALGAALAGLLAAQLGARLAFVWTGAATLGLTAMLGLAITGANVRGATGSTTGRSGNA